MKITGHLQSLTPKEKLVLEYIQEYIFKNEISPTYSEIKEHFQFASINSVQNYLKQLVAKGYINIPGENLKRAIQILHTAEDFKDTNKPETKPLPLVGKVSSLNEVISVPLLGKVAAGRPIESLSHDEVVDVPPSLLRKSSAGKTFALKVAGQSMIEDGIFDGDVILVQEQNSATNGEIVVAVVDSEATVKRYFNRTKEKGKIELRPSNSEMDSFWYSPDSVELKGVVVGLMRKF